MSYALALAATDSGQYCPLMTGAPSGSEVRAQWAKYRDKWGCPERLGPFWFFTGASSLQWYGQVSSLVRPILPAPADVSQRTMAFDEWRRAHPSDWWCPPFLLDYSNPEDPYAVPPPVQSNEPVLPVAPPTTIPCYCWSSPGFKDVHRAAYAQVQKDCEYQSNCMQKASTINLINYRAMESGGGLCATKYNPCCAETAGRESCPTDAATATVPTSSSKRNVTTLVGLSALGIAGYLILRRRQQARARRTTP